MKKIICLLLCLVLMLPAVVSCSKAPEYSEIEDRLKELIEASYEINEIFFGMGLPTYERVYDPKSTVQVLIKPDPEDPAKERRIYYYELNDPTLGRVIAFRSSYIKPYEYLQVLSEKDATRTPFYEEDGVYCYLLTEYTEPSYDLFYDDDDPVDYDYVRADTGYLSIEQIKESASLVYSAEYLESIYEMLFVGAAGVTEGSQILSARYMEHTDPETGEVWLMKSNTIDPLVTEKRLYDFSTAKIVRPKNGQYVTVEIESYLESTPDDRLTVKLGLCLQNGEWMLDSATY
ncbi:MAG: hypothetical protein J6Q82_08475 [Clostridia bacterium]|nr:hypothetical protein [Clostridia bacterium]